MELDQSVLNILIAKIAGKQQLAQQLRNFRDGFIFGSFSDMLCGK